MSDVIGRGTIEVSADAHKLQAGIAEAKRSLKDLGIAAGDATKGQSASIDRYVKSLGIAAVTAGATGRELELLKLGARGASAAQLAAADSALRMTERHEQWVKVGEKVHAGFVAIGTIAATSLIAAAAAFDALIKKAGEFQDMAEKVGDTAENLASLAVSAAIGGTSMDAVVAASVKLTKNLTGVDDESKAAGAAIVALGLNLETFKALKPADQFETVAKALDGFKEGTGKTAVALALFGKAGAEMLPFLKELGAEGGRQTILTEEQIRLADEYADKQKKLHEQISLHAQAIASDLLPQITALKTAIVDLAKDEEHAATASDLLKGAFSAAVVPLQAIAVAASELGFVFLGVGREIGAIAAQMAALARLDFAGFHAISDAVKEDGERARAELDKFQAKLMALGQPAAAGPKLRSAFPEPGAFGEEKPKLEFSGAVKAEKAGLKADLTAERELARLLAEDRRGLLAGIQATTDASDDFLRSTAEAGDKARASLKQQNDLLDKEAQAWKDLVDPMEVFRRQFAEIDALFQANKLSAGEWAAATDIVTKKMGEVGKVAEESSDVWKTAAKDMQRAMSEGFYDILTNKTMSFGEKFKQMTLRMVSDWLAAQAQMAIFGNFAKTGEMGGLLGKLMARFGGGGDDIGWQPAFDPAVGPMAAGGADWMVGGSGGTDSKLAQFRVTPGERVIVQTPAQQAASGGITIINHTTGRIDRASYVPMPGGERAVLIEEAVNATAAQFGNPNSNVSRAMGRSYSVQRSR